MEQKKVALIHTGTFLVQVFANLVKEALPGVKVFNIVDESLLNNTIETGRMTPQTARRLAGYIASAEEAGADAIMVTCSSVGAAVDAAAPFAGVPVLRVDRPMADEAVRTGRRIGVIATLPTTLQPTAELVRTQAAAQGRELMGQVDVIVLAQASMARVVETLSPQERTTPIFSSPRLGVEALKKTLAAQEAPGEPTMSGAG